MRLEKEIGACRVEGHGGEIRYARRDQGVVAEFGEAIEPALVGAAEAIGWPEASQWPRVRARAARI